MPDSTADHMPDQTADHTADHAADHTASGPTNASGSREPTLRPVGDGLYIDDTPSRRYPVYTRGNAGEVYPEVFYPLSWSLTAADGDDAFLRSSYRSGITTPEDFTEPDTAKISGVFAGYAYLNLSYTRMVAQRMLGATVDDVDRAVLGNSEAPPYVPHPDDKNLRATLRGARYAWQTLRTTELPQLTEDQLTVDRWLAGLPDPTTATDDELVRELEDSALIFSLFETHLFISGQAAVGLGALQGLCTDRLGDESLAMTLVSGLGDVDSAAPSLELWDLGRRVADSSALTALFDSGIGTVSETLASDATSNPDLVAFGAAFDRFIDTHGCRGPNEWESACDTWGTRPELPLAIIDRMRFADADHDPSLQRDRLRREREAASEEARAALPRPLRGYFDMAERTAQLFFVGRERSKTTVVRAIHGVRLLARELGARLADRTPEGRPDDLWFVLQAEVAAYRHDPAAFTATIAERRRMRETLAELIPPFIFSGTIPPIDEWERRVPLDAADAPPTVAAGESITGIAGCPGVARGRARVVLDPAEPGDLGPGDVLVAPATDPAWTPLFVPAEAVVVDVGAQISHAVIVSRELGIPCAVSVTDATRRIPDGALIEVDGTTGIVTVIDLVER